MATDAKSIPMFFICFNTVNGSTKLHLPEPWCACMGRSLPYEAFLRNMHGDVWQVKVANYQNTDRFWFDEGWINFAEENKLANDDRIVFRYDGKFTYDFMLFDKNGVEKDYVRLPREMEQLQDEHMVLEFEPERDELQNMIPEPERDEQRNMNPELEGDEQGNMIPEPEQEAGQNMQREPTLDHESEYSASVGEDGNNQGQTTGSTMKTVRRERAPYITEKHQEAIFRVGFPHPNNPYFLTKRSSKHSKLFVPKRITRDPELAFPEEIGIHDEKGRVWAATVHKGNDRVWISEGWLSFCMHNNVKKEGWCIIEILKPQPPEHHQIYLQARLVPEAIVRAARRL